MSAGVSEGTCGCRDFTMSRRRLLAGTAATGLGLTAAGVFGDAVRQVAYAAASGGSTVVVLSLRGGADGLSMVVPRGADHDVLAKARPGIVVPESALIGGDESFGLHPAFAPVLPMWKAGTFGAVHAVGLPVPNRSHFEAMEQIEDADPGSSARTGWINRMVGATPQAEPETSVALGSGLVPTSQVGPAPSLAARQVADLTLADLGSTAAARRRSVRRTWSRDTGVLGDSVRSALSATERLGPLVKAAGQTKGGAVHGSAYPDGPLRDVLANTAALIRADVGTSVVTVDYGNWDMHTGIGQPGNGWMHDQVSHLAGSVKAFFDDLGAAASRVTLVTMSEFGRRLQENGDHGLDHGYGNAMLMFGAGVNGGRVNGRWPHLQQLDDGDLLVRQDFRSVLWEVLSHRFPHLSGDRARVFPALAAEQVGAMA